MKALVLAALAACGSHAPAPSEPPAVTQTTACPATYAQAKGPCDGANTVTTCGYQEGTCTCEVPGGAGDGPAAALRTPESSAPADAGPPPQAEWRCTAPAVRGDGCPGKPPDGTCDHEGQQCGYGDTCTVQYACVGGTWRRLRQDCPP